MKNIFILAFLIPSLCFSFGSRRWYDGPSERRSHIKGAAHHAANCMPAPKFNHKKIRLKYEPVRGEKKFSSGWAYRGHGGRWVHGEAFLNSKTNFLIKVATDPQGNFTIDSEHTERHELGHVVAWNQFRDSSHDPKYRRCFRGWSDDGTLHHDIWETVYDETGAVIFDTSVAFE